MKVIPTPLPGVCVLDPVVHGDDRGYFYEAFHDERFRQAGIALDIRQTNISRSTAGVLRGLHHQWPNPQGKLVSVLEGEVYDVAVDIRRGSPTFGQSFGCVLSADNKRQLWIPEGYAHGFCVISEAATFMYQCTRIYERQHDKAIRWNDASLGIDWPVSRPILSAKDTDAPYLHEIPDESLPTWIA